MEMMQNKKIESMRRPNVIRLFLYISLINGVFAKTSTIGKKFGNKELIQNAGNFVSSRSLTANLQPESVAVLPNPRFIFHNKIPKAGSTTMSNILQALEDRNGFDMLHFRPCVEQPCQKEVDGIAKTTMLANEIRSKVSQATPSKPVVVLKHHLYTNFTNYGLETPTWINVARDPVNRFVSAYYFRRFGFNRHEGVRNEKLKKGLRDINMDVDECIHTGATECSGEANQAFLEYICGSPNIWPECSAYAELSRDIALERAKKHVMLNYFVIGVFEDFENTIRLFEKMIPSVFWGAADVYEKLGEQMQNQTQTAKKKQISVSARRKLEYGPLRHQVDLYNLIKALFEEKLYKYGVKK